MVEHFTGEKGVARLVYRESRGKVEHFDGEPGKERPTVTEYRAGNALPVVRVRH